MLSIKVLHLTLYTHVHTNLGTSSLKLKNAYRIYRAYLRSSDRRYLLAYPISQLDRRSENQRASGSPGRANIWKSLQLGSYNHFAAEKLGKKYGPVFQVRMCNRVSIAIFSSAGERLIIGPQTACRFCEYFRIRQRRLDQPADRHDVSPNPTHIPQDHL